MQEAIARVVSYHHAKLEGTRFHFYGRRVDDGYPTPSATHLELGDHFTNLQHHLISMELALDAVHARFDYTIHNLEHANGKLQAKN